MAEANQELEYGPESHTCTYPPAVPCPECGGSGKIVLFVVPRACHACQGSGRVWPPALYEHVPPKLGYWQCEWSFDSLGRLIAESRWFEPVEEADTGSERPLSVTPADEPPSSPEPT